ncbi:MULTISPECIES: winged helix-turn-helix domain-containing protein [Rhodococcus]|uniref:winged helix-turn-helix domain-containing protein n=1 Tax=Rhodococcus TaxID=1827 RepID=UPI0007AEA718|nr:MULTISPECIES: crosslink repair DNA glycosylase YcaQ family protein [Rhodococcus]KZL35055.1 hypothetical protein A3852_04680 [Rhodococcus qingshengii]MBQ9052534.1 YcaQ family DNA glycosylase [Rhodococcus sp. (in: high G+C Gram-positive bacteria)]MCE4163270.1 winged helix-turn-helix domain-containing protein [Rhodococcus sp. Ni2]
MSEVVSLAAARRIALAAQGFGKSHPTTVTRRNLVGVMDRLQVLQIDSVNVFERSHYLPVYARLGAYDKSRLDQLAFAPGSGYLEYWGHEATFLPVDMWPLFRWRMDQFRAKALSDKDGWASDRSVFLDWLRQELRDNGPMAASEIEHEANTRRGPWWGWSDVKVGLETLFRWGEVVSAGRAGFERRYGLAEQMLAPEILDAHVERSEAIRELVLRGVKAHGLGTLDDIADYFRLPSAEARTALQELEDAGSVRRVSVDGWERRGKAREVWIDPRAKRPRSIRADALLSPFDPVVWARDRALRLFDFHYRIEIYTPAHKRVHGYYVLPVLIDDKICARVDLKNDRQNRRLLVRAAWAEPTADADTAPRLAELLRRTARWQGCDTIEVENKGTLSQQLAAAMR